MKQSYFFIWFYTSLAFEEVLQGFKIKTTVELLKHLLIQHQEFKTPFPTDIYDHLSFN